MLSHRPLVVILLLLLSSYGMSLAALINRTIDDEYGDSMTGDKLTYFPSGASRWKQGRNCTDCIISLPSHVGHRTWHDCTQHPDDPEVCSITAHFNGTAVYVYNVIASYTYSNASQRTVTYLTFELDGHAADELLDFGNGRVRYDVPVYANHSLTDGPHTLVIRVPPGPIGKDWSLALFNYIKYTTSTELPTTRPALPSDVDTPTSTLTPPPAPLQASRQSSTGVKVGCTVGGAAAATLAIGGILVLRRRRRIPAHIDTHADAPLRCNEHNVPAVEENPERRSGEGMRIRALEAEMVHIRALVEQPPEYEAESPELVGHRLRQ